MNTISGLKGFTFCFDIQSFQSLSSYQCEFKEFLSDELDSGVQCWVLQISAPFPSLPGESWVYKANDVPSGRVPELWGRGSALIYSCPVSTRFPAPPGLLTWCTGSHRWSLWSLTNKSASLNGLFPAPLWPLNGFVETSGFPPGIAQATGNQKCSLRLTYVPIFLCCLTSPSLMSLWKLLWGGHFQKSYRLLLVCPGPCPTSPPQTSPGPGDLLLASFTCLSPCSLGQERMDVAPLSGVLKV